MTAEEQQAQLDVVVQREIEKLAKSLTRQLARMQLEMKIERDSDRTNRQLQVRYWLQLHTPTGAQQ